MSWSSLQFQIRVLHFSFGKKARNLVASVGFTNHLKTQKLKSLVSAFLGAALGRGSLPPYWSMRRSKAFPHGLA